MSYRPVRLPRSSSQLIRHESSAFVARLPRGFWRVEVLVNRHGRGEEVFGAHDMDTALGINELGDVDVAGGGDEGVGFIAGDVGMVGILLGEKGDHVADSHLGGGFEVLVETHGDILRWGFAAGPKEMLILVNDELERASELSFKSGDVDFAVALSGVAVPDFEESAFGVDGDI